MTGLRRLLFNCSDEDYYRFVKKIKFPYTKNKKISMKKCWIWKKCGNNDIPRFWFNGQTIPTSRAVYQIVHNKKPNKCYHTCGNYKCVNPNHIKSGTQSEYIINAIKFNKYTDIDGMFKQSVLTFNQLKSIYELLNNGLTIIQISKKLNIKYHLIRDTIYYNNHKSAKDKNNII